ncbi:hypothetical protein Tco_0899426 [Tanacetum coccineum]
MGFPVGSIVWALEARIGVAMAYSSWVQHKQLPYSQVEWECYQELPGMVGLYVGTTLDLVSLVKEHCSPKVNVLPVGIH